MVKYCPSCGTKLEQEYNFCPSCGFDLRNIAETEKKDEGNKESQVKGIIICDNCGEENEAGNNICSYCGAPLKGEKIEKKIYEKRIVQEIKPGKEKRKESKVSSAKIKNPSVKPQPVQKNRQLDQKKLLLILAVAIVIVFVILLSSGVLDSTSTNQDIQNQQQVSNQSSGVDLNNIQRINELEAKVKENPNDTETLLELAHLKNDSGMYDQAIIDYKKYLEKIPKDPDARIDLGVCYYNLHNYDDAIKQMEIAIQYSPKHQIGYLNLGIVNLAAGNFDKSKEWLQKAVQLDPGSEAGKKAKELLDSHSK